MSKLYTLYPNRDFRDNLGYFNSIFRSEVTFSYMMPIESIISSDEIKAEDKVNKINEIIGVFSEKKEEMYKWRDEILEKFIHSKL